MKNLFLRTLMTATLATAFAFAQDAPANRPQRGNRGAMEELGLSPEQKTQVQSIMKDQRAAMAEARKNNADKTQLQQIRQQTHDKLAGVLNADQMKKFDERAKSAKRRHRKG